MSCPQCKVDAPQGEAHGQPDLYSPQLVYVGLNHNSLKYVRTCHNGHQWMEEKKQAYTPDLVASMFSKRK